MSISGRFGSSDVTASGTSTVTLDGAGGPVTADLEGISKLYVNPVDGAKSRGGGARPPLWHQPTFPHPFLPAPKYHLKHSCFQAAPETLVQTSPALSTVPEPMNASIAT